jgi:putative membrane protein (TIGR04086 family)
MGKRKKRSQGKGRILLRGVLAGAATILLGVLLLAFFVYLGWLPESTISIGNTIIKILAALASGIAIGLSKTRAPWYFGGIAAILSLLIATVGMALYLGAFPISLNLLADLLMTFAIGSAASAALGRRSEA